MDREMTDPKIDVPPLEENPDDGIHRVLLIANERFRGEDFLKELRGHLDGPVATVETFVITPALVERALQQEITDTDRAIADANARLDSVIAALGEVGISAVGQVGDVDPAVAVGDGLRMFPADEVIVVSHREGQRPYGEKTCGNGLNATSSFPSRISRYRDLRRKVSSATRSGSGMSHRRRAPRKR